MEVLLEVSRVGNASLGS